MEREGRTSRPAARRRVRVATTWTAAGAAALTGGLAIRAALADKPQAATSHATTQAPAATQDETESFDDGVPAAPPTATTEAPAATSGGS